MRRVENLLNHLWETLKHKGRVAWNLFRVCAELVKRAAIHDLSKFGPVEAPLFAEVTPELEGTTYGSEYYDELLDRLGVALSHHYENNSHHPEHYDGTVGSMPLLDVLEMLCDWEAAVHRHADGDLEASVLNNADRFEYGEDTVRKFREFYEGMGWM